MEVLYFYENFIKLSVSEQNNFKRIVNKLLQVNLLTGHKESDSNDYYFIMSHYKLLKTFFAFMDCNLLHDEKYAVFALDNLQANMNLKLRLNESIVLLILRLLYSEKMKDVSLINQTVVCLGDIHEQFIATGLKKRRISKTELKKILSLFKRYNLLEFIDPGDFTDSSRILLYPTLLYAVRVSNINKVYDSLAPYRNEESLCEETGKN